MQTFRRFLGLLAHSTVRRVSPRHVSPQTTATALFFEGSRARTEAVGTGRGEEFGACGTKARAGLKADPHSTFFPPRGRIAGNGDHHPGTLSPTLASPLCPRRSLPRANAPAAHARARCGAPALSRCGESLRSTQPDSHERLLGLRAALLAEAWHRDPLLGERVDKVVCPVHPVMVIKLVGALGDKDVKRWPLLADKGEDG
mmetsp:Transcript_26978/g.81673  ORF Transcript_26978/g.81673 Transcript_26978/m.81673 type:complete len:201 (-) Transcript_26978:846-1448(-)